MINLLLTVAILRKQIIRPITLLVLSVLALVSTSGAQTSSADSLDSIRARFDRVEQQVALTVRGLSSHPGALEDGSLASSIQMYCGKDLAEIQSQLTQQLQIIGEKEKGISSNAQLEASDKKQLLSALDQQKKPASKLEARLALLQKGLLDLQAKLPNWKAVYDSFRQVSGDIAAGQKLRSLTDEFCKQYDIPKATPVPEPVYQPTPRVVSHVEQSSMASPTPASTPAPPEHHKGFFGYVFGFIWHHPFWTLIIVLFIWYKMKD